MRLASGIVGKYLIFRSVSTRNIYNQKTKIYFFDSWSEFAVLQSSLHQEWAFWTSATLGASTLSYSTSASLETWPMPSPGAIGNLSEVGESYHRAREDRFVANNIGPTEFYNKIHDSSQQDSWVNEFRLHHEQLDLAVLAAYQWSDIDLEHGFHAMDYLPPRDCVRFAISPRARIEVLRRLSALNHERYSEEEAAEARRGAVKRGRRTKAEAVPSLLDDERLAEE